MDTRAAPYGGFLVPSPPAGRFAWNAASPLDFVLLPAGHRAGLYSFSICLQPMVPAGVGTTSIDITWDQPGVGPFTFPYAAASSLTAVSGGFRAPREIQSSGRGPISARLVPAGVTGSPLIYVNFPIDFILGLFPAGFPS